MDLPVDLRILPKGACSLTPYSSYSTLHLNLLSTTISRMSKYDRRRVNGPTSYIPAYESTGGASSSTTTLNSASQTRPDNRSYAELRPIFLQTNLVPSASGSSYVEIGDLKLACSVFGPRQVKGRQYSGKAELNVEVKFAPFSSRRRRTPGKVSFLPLDHPPYSLYSENNHTHRLSLVLSFSPILYSATLHRQPKVPTSATCFTKPFSPLSDSISYQKLRLISTSWSSKRTAWKNRALQPAASLPPPPSLLLESKCSVSLSAPSPSSPPLPALRRTNVHS